MKNEGNQNAVKSDDGAATSTIIFRCTPVLKNLAVKAANKENLKLTEWLIKTVEEALDK